MPNCFTTRHESASGMRIPSHPPIRPAASARANAAHGEAVEEISSVEAAKFRKEKQGTEQNSAKNASRLPTITEPQPARTAHHGRWRHSVPFLAQFIGQTHWSRPRRADKPAPDAASQAYDLTENMPQRADLAASNPALSRLI